MKILFFGDIDGKIARQALKQILPEWLKKYQPEAVIGNVENLAHGNSITKSTLEELKQIGFSGFTLGDHAFDRPESIDLIQDSSWFIARPANFPHRSPGQGYIRLVIRDRDLIVINLLGRVFTGELIDCPFRTVDSILADLQQDHRIGGIIVDIHAEATSEKIALGWYLNGRVSAVLGTHTHVPTRDEWILPQGTAYITDVGMTGGKEGVIGVKKELSLQRFLTVLPIHFEPQEKGLAQVNAVLIDIESKIKSAQIQHLTAEVTI